MARLLLFDSVMIRPLRVDRTDVNHADVTASHGHVQPRRRLARAQHGPPEPERHDHRVVTMVLEHLQRHYTSRTQTALPHLATLVGTAPHTLSRLVHDATGDTIETHITRLRVLAATHLLRETTWRLPRIAHAVGYQNHADLSSALQHMLKTPLPLTDRDVRLRLTEAPHPQAEVRRHPLRQLERGRRLLDGVTVLHPTAAPAWH